MDHLNGHNNYSSRGTRTIGSPCYKAEKTEHLQTEIGAKHQLKKEKKQTNQKDGDLNAN